MGSIENTGPVAGGVGARLPEDNDGIDLITARSVSGDNTQAMFDMFSAA